MSKEHAETLHIYLDCLASAKELDNTYLENAIKKLIGTFIREQNKKYRSGEWE